MTLPESKKQISPSNVQEGLNSPQSGFNRRKLMKQNHAPSYYDQMLFSSAQGGMGQVNLYLGLLRGNSKDKGKTSS